MAASWSYDYTTNKNLPVNDTGDTVRVAGLYLFAVLGFLVALNWFIGFAYESYKNTELEEQK